MYVWKGECDIKPYAIFFVGGVHITSSQNRATGLSHKSTTPISGRKEPGDRVSFHS